MVVVVWMAELKCLDDLGRLNSYILDLILTVKTYWGHDSVIGTVDSSISQHHLNVEYHFVMDNIAASNDFEVITNYVRVCRNDN